MTVWYEVRRAYDAMAATYHEWLPDLRAEQPLDRAMIAAFAEQVRLLQPASVLDAGCGTGRMVGFLRGLGLDVIGVDLSPGMVGIARTVHPDVGFQVADLRHLPFADDTFAGVLAWYSLIYCAPDDLAAALRELTRVLAPGGYLLAGFQAGTGTRSLNDPDADVHMPELFLRTVDEMSAAFGQAGLTVAARCFRAAQPDSYDGGHDQGFVLGHLSAVIES